MLILNLPSDEEVIALTNKCYYPGHFLLLISDLPLRFKLSSHKSQLLFQNCPPYHEHFSSIALSLSPAPCKQQAKEWGAQVQSPKHSTRWWGDAEDIPCQIGWTQGRRYLIRCTFFISKKIWDVEQKWRDEEMKSGKVQKTEQGESYVFTTPINCLTREGRWRKP